MKFCIRLHHLCMYAFNVMSPIVYGKEYRATRGKIMVEVSELRKMTLNSHMVNCAVTNHSAMHNVAWYEGISMFTLDWNAARFALKYSKLLCILKFQIKGEGESACNHIRDVVATSITIKMSLQVSGQCQCLGLRNSVERWICDTLTDVWIVWAVCWHTKKNRND